VIKVASQVQAKMVGMDVEKASDLTSARLDCCVS
jgi:hypothetical protein